MRQSFFHIIFIHIFCRQTASASASGWGYSYPSASAAYAGGSGSYSSYTSAALATSTSSSGWSSSQVWTTSAAPATSVSSGSSSTYGSGSSNWGNQNYNNCVQRMLQASRSSSEHLYFLTECVASFGGPSASYTPPTATSVSSSGSGATHTVIVAPTQGVLRFVPFAVNASVGDTIQFMWGANNHTVTKSSALTPCNKTAAQPFSSGEQNKGFVCKAYSL